MPAKHIINTLDEQVDLLRLDLVDKLISGNKWYKLKYNLEKAIDEKHTTILTFGGAFSNHIYATAAAAKKYGLRSIGVIRGEPPEPLNTTLAFASSQGMDLHFISRTEYRNKYDPQFQETLFQKFGSFFLIPEGGTNPLALKGMAEVVQEINKPYDLWVVPVGTGGTLAGLASGLKNDASVLGISVLKNAFGVENDIQALLLQNGIKSENWYINHEYHFGGYAKFTEPLYRFILEFYNKNGILLDPIYTGKMMYALFSLKEKGQIPPDKKILAVHTGGIQGWAGMADRYEFIDRSLPFY